MEGYCFKCRDRRQIKNAVQVRMKNGRIRVQGVCQVCNTKISTLGKG